MRFTRVVLFFIAVAFFTGNAHAELYMGISGRVVEEGSNIPLPNVQLILMSQTKGNMAEGKSDAQGNFALKWIPQGPYDIIAIPQDSYTMPLKKPFPVTVPLGKNVVGVTVKLSRGGVVKGKVLTSTGIPVPQATILGTSGMSATTNDDGTFMIKGVTPGTTTLAVMAPAIGVRTATAICEAGKTADAGNIVLPIGPESTIKGTVVDTTGTPIPGAILVASGKDISGGYSMSIGNGSFFITGLATSTFKLTAVAFGYEPVTLADIPVPTANLNIVLTPSPTKTAGLIRYRLGQDDMSDVERMYSELVPAAYPNCQLGNCPEGKWYGISFDVSGLINIPLLTLSSGRSVSIGTHRCNSSLARFEFKTICDYYGATYSSIASIGVGGSGIFTWNACCAEDHKGTSSGVVYMFGRPSLYGYGAIDSGSGDVKYASWGGGWGFSLFDWRSVLADINGLQRIDHSVTYRSCDTQQFNIFEYLCSIGYCL